MEVVNGLYQNLSQLDYTSLTQQYLVKINVLHVMQAQQRSRGIAPLIPKGKNTHTAPLDVGGRSTRRHNHFNRREGNPVLIAKVAMWASRPVWRGKENLTPPRFEPRTVHAVPSRYADYVIPVATTQNDFCISPTYTKIYKETQKSKQPANAAFSNVTLNWHNKNWIKMQNRKRDVFTDFSGKYTNTSILSVQRACVETGIGVLTNSDSS
jgi:hypothetical protein